MKMFYEILYKNGKEDTIEVDLNEETTLLLREVNETLEEAMKEDLPAVITFGDGASGGHYIRVSDICRAKISVQEG
ncbi:hypothetical protein [Lederbergia lenta]|uniref:hypothetical protein n=1 Tax=Lederbergia lenta TaxID=1467 RepID=UPI00203C42AF|nr:hypothetical protein [Lederbergia lenta]MCM3110664.1 hypothetical protein [Lederbergia lenta]